MVVGLSIGSLPLIMVIDYCIAVARVNLKKKWTLAINILHLNTRVLWILLPVQVLQIHKPLQSLKKVPKKSVVILLQLYTCVPGMCVYYGMSTRVPV